MCSKILSIIAVGAVILIGIAIWVFASGGSAVSAYLDEENE